MKVYPGPRNLSPFHANLNSIDLGIRLYGVVCKNKFICQFYTIISVVWITSRTISRWFAKIIHMSILHDHFSCMVVHGQPPRIIPIRIKLFDWKFVRNPIDMYNFIFMVSMNVWGRVEENEQREHLVVLHTNIRKLMFLKQNQSLIK